jgi:hypothetical protein
VPFFAFFTEMHRLLQPDGRFVGMVPRWDAVTAYGDPDHKRIINELTLVYLSQAKYVRQVGITAMSDYRRLYKADFEIVEWNQNDLEMWFILRAIKT